MVLNYIWIAFFVIAFVVAVVQTFVYGNTGIWTDIMNASFSSARSAFNISLGLTGVLTLWLGLMKIGERGGVVAVLSRWISPLFSRLFPGVPKGHPALGSMFMNVSANMLGLDNAATPLGLKAMRELQELNPKKDTATDAMLMFLVLNASGLTLIPIGVMTYRAQMGGSQSFGRFLAHFNRHVHGDVRGAFGIVYQTANQYIRPGNSAMGIGAYRFCGRGVLLFLLFAGREDFVLFGFCSQQYSVYDYRNFLSWRGCQANQCL